MPTTVSFDLSQVAAYQSVPVLPTGWITVRPLRRTATDELVLLTTEYNVRIVDGVGVETVDGEYVAADLDLPTDVTIYYQMRAKFPGTTSTTDTFAIGDGLTVTYGELLNPDNGYLIDPTTLDPAAPLDPAWLSSLAAEIATRAAADVILTAAAAAAQEAADEAAAATALVSTFARSSGPAFVPIKKALADATRATAIQILGDSTGNDVNEWPALLAADLAADYPAWTVQRRLWDDTTQDFVAPVTLQTGTGGLERLVCDGSHGRRYLAHNMAGIIDVRAKVSLPDWTPATARVLTGSVNSSTTRAWYVTVTTNGRPSFVFSTDGSAVTSITCSAAPVVADGEITWLRWLFNPNDGLGNRVTKFYDSPDGITWTQLGSTVTTATPVTLFSPPAGSYFTLGGASIGAASYWNGDVYEVQIREGDSGPLVAPALPTLWHVSGSGQLPTAGAPTLTFVNGSKAGADIVYLGDPARLAKMTPEFGQALTFLSSSHNESFQAGREWMALYDVWRNQVEVALPGSSTVILTQNPENGATFAPEHALRRLDLVAYARQAALDCIDTYQAFLDYGDWAADLMADTVHPNPAGSAVWADAVYAAFQSA